MGDTKDIATQLGEAQARRQSAFAAPDSVTRLAEDLLETAWEGIRPAERALGNALHQMVSDETTRPFLTKLCTHVLMTTDPALQIATLRGLAGRKSELPTVLNRAAQWRLRAAALLPESLSAYAVREAHRAFHSVFGGLVLPAHVRRLMLRVHQLSTDGQGVALNPLVPVVRGNKGAAQYMKKLEAVLERQDAAGVVVQPWRLCPNLSPYSPEEGVRALASRLHQIFRLSLAKGRTRPVIVESGLSPTAHMVAEALTIALQGQDLNRADVAIELPAYLAGTPAILRGLTTWAGNRAAAGAAPLKLLLVKGAHLDEEQECTVRHGSANAVCRTKAETDARYKQMVHAAMAADPRAVTPVIGSHNLFDIAFALVDWAGSGRPGMPPYCLEGGLANHVARTLGELGCRVTLTYGVTPAGQDAAAARHLLNIVHKLSRPGSFFASGYEIDPQSPTWGRLHREFTESLTPQEEQPGEAADGIFRPTPRARVFNRKRLTALRHAGEREANRWQRPLVAADDGFPGSEELPCERISTYNTEHVDYRFLAMDDATLESLVASAAQAAATPVEPWEERRAHLLRLAAELEMKESTFIGLLIRECGLTLEEAEKEILMAMDACRLHVQTAEPTGTGSGVVAVMPGDAHPLADAVGGIAAAWMAGNAVVYRPPFGSVMLGVRIAELFKQQEFLPPRLLTAICTDDASVRLAANPRITAVLAVTDSTRSASLCTAAAGKPVIGGCCGSSSVYLAATADWHTAVRDIAANVFTHAGQCLEMPHIVIVHASVYDNQEFRNELQDAVRSIICGPGWEEGVQMGLLSAVPTHEQELLLTAMDADETWLVQPHRAGKDIALWSPGVRAGVEAGRFFTQATQNVPAIGLLRVKDAEEAIALQQKLAEGQNAAIYSRDEEEIHLWERHVDACNRCVNCICHPYPGIQPQGDGQLSTPMTGGRQLAAALAAPRDADAAALEGEEPQLPVKPWLTLQPAPSAEDAQRMLTAAKSITSQWEAEFGREHMLRENAMYRTTLSYRPLRLTLRAEQNMPDGDLCIMLMAALAAGCRVQLSTATLRPWMQNMLYPEGVEIAVETRGTFEGRFATLAGQGICVRDPAATEETRRTAGVCRLELITRPVTSNGRSELLCCTQEQVVTRRGSIPENIL